MYNLHCFIAGKGINNSYHFLATTKYECWSFKQLGLQLHT